MTPEIVLIPLVLGAIGYILYQIKTIIFTTIFVSLNIEELGSFMEATMKLLKKSVINQNWIIGRFSMVKLSPEELKPTKEGDLLSLDTGFYIGKLYGKFILVNIVDEKPTSFFDAHRHPSIQLITFRWNSSILIDFLAEVRRTEEPIDVLATGWDYEVIRGRKRHDFDGLFLPSGVKNDIISTIEWFIRSEDWYAKMKQPYKLVFLLYGSPGTGKTAIANAIADRTTRSLTHIRLTSDKENNDLSHETISMISNSKNSVILIDEIDKIFVDNESKSKVDATALLSILNGEFLSGQIIILCCNNLENIPESFRNSLLRSRRIDKKYEFGKAIEEQKKNACKFYNIPYNEDIKNCEFMSDVLERIIDIKRKEHDSYSMKYISSYD